MQAVDTLLLPRWVIPMEPAGLTLADHAVVLDGDRIVAVCPRSEAQTRYKAHATITLDGHALLPGLVNTHTHAAMCLLRGFADDMPLMTWLNDHIWPAEQRWVSPEFVTAGTHLAMAEMIRGGITCFNDMYFFPDAAAAAARDAGLRARVGMIVIEFPSAWARNAEEYMDKGLTLHQALQGQDLIGTTLAPHAPYTVSPARLGQIAELAARLDVPVHMHVHETADEVGNHQQQHGCRPWRTLADAGLVDSRLMAVHMTQLTTGEIEEAAARGVSVVHCPESNLKLASGFCPMHQLDRAGVNLALGTDGAASNNDLDMFGEMRCAALLAKGFSGDAAAVPAVRALEMATLGGARAMKLDHEIGSVVAGKSADLIAVDLTNLESEPVYDPVSQLVYACGRHQVTDVWVAGRRLLQNRILTSLDAGALLDEARTWRRRIAGERS